MIELLVLAGTFAVTGWVAGAKAHRRLAAARALERYARSRGVVFVPPPETPRGASPRVLGSKEDLAYVVELFRLGSDVHTRVSALARHGRVPRLCVLQRGAFRTPKSPVLETGDPDIDRAYVVTAAEPPGADGLRDARQWLGVLAERCQSVWISTDGIKVAVSWRGVESDPVVLDAARDVVVHLASRHSSELPYR